MILPEKLGIRLATLLHRPFFGRLGKRVRIHPSARFARRKAIRIGDQSSVGPNAILEADTPKSSIVIGKRCQISSFVVLKTYQGFIQLGDNCSVNPFCVLYGHGGLTIGNDVRIATGTTIIPANHVFERTDLPITAQGLTCLGVVIEDDVWIGANVTLLDGVRIGTGSVIAAGAVVTKSVEPRSVMGGVPARLIKRRT